MVIKHLFAIVVVVDIVIQGEEWGRLIELIMRDDMQRMSVQKYMPVGDYGPSLVFDQGTEGGDAIRWMD